MNSHIPKQLSRRLEAIIDMVPEGPSACVADIGTDHGYVPIRLVQGKKAVSALAVDVGRGPLARAGEHIRANGLEGRIQTRLSDGLKKIEPGEADGVVIAGMGGELMLRILREAGRHRETVRWWVLSPQSELSLFRHGLMKLGLSIRSERMLREDGKDYVILLAGPGKMEYEYEYQYRYGDCLIRQKSPELRDYLSREKKQLSAILSGLGSREGEAVRRRREELLEALLVLKEAEKAYDALP